MPAAGKSSRASARKRRFIRLRTTALPIFLVTVKPTRIVRIAVAAVADEQDEAGHRRAPAGIGGEEVGAVLENRRRD